MKHYNRDTFTYETEGENAVGTSGVTFTIGADGKATHVLVENLNVRGEGTFNRVPREMNDDSLEASANPPNPDIIAQEIVEDLEAALSQFAALASDVK